MPIIEVKAFDRRFDDRDAATRLISELTRAFGSVYGEDAARETEVILHGISPAFWGFGGTTRA
jgi:phenylpyruvate tautomerase PptA (4-oxalocrotonate tautomerase family)